MNKLLTLTQWLLAAIVVISVVVIAQTATTLWQTNKINNFIEGDSASEVVPENLKAQFSQAFRDVQQDKSDSALDGLTLVLETDDPQLKAAAYFNRGNIHLRKAKTMGLDDTKRIPLIGLAKQDYRDALLLNASFWDARFNLELALLMAPEEPPPAEEDVDKSKNSHSVRIETHGFKVILP